MTSRWEAISDFELHSALITYQETCRPRKDERQCASSRCWTEEATQFLRRPLRNFLWKEVAAIERLTTDIAGPFPPYRQRATCLSIPAVQRSSTAPEREHGAGYASPSLAIIQIMLMVEGRSRSIFLADRVNACAEEPQSRSALSTTASGAADTSRSGSGSGCASSDHGQ